MSVFDLVIGKPLATSEERAEHIGPVDGIPIFGLDALSSAAYGPEAALTLLIPPRPRRRLVHRPHQPCDHRPARHRLLLLPPDHRRLPPRRRQLHRRRREPRRARRPPRRRR